MSRGRGRGNGKFGQKQGIDIIQINDSTFRRNRDAQTNSYVSSINNDMSAIDNALTNEYHSLMTMLKTSQSYLRPPLPPKDIERYSDKYIKEKPVKRSAQLTHITTDMSFFPPELHSVIDKTKTKKVKAVNQDFLKLLKDIKDDDKSGDEDEAEEEEAEEEEYIDEDELDGDYADNYFDNGEMDDDDDGGDENYF
ncbi:hypothetical protein DSO57_1039557 [Entomophthora muscae]|uniref:Uncharacterized protein n=2 Tax=Entomophthora muscae TaxID=34485 RepID=A0ACC2SYD7_9FUNG|nr:hypothetical protein DSO57_1039557 [Entomophthora muscae]